MKNYVLQPKRACCPVCFNGHGLVLYTVNAEQSAQHFVLRQIEPSRHQALKTHIESLWRQSTCDVVRCASCGFCFADPFIAGDVRFYELAYQRSSYPRWKWEFERTRKAMATLRKTESLDIQMLEIGAGDGAFTRRIAPALTAKENILCTEYSSYGIDVIESYGVRCLSQDVRSLSLTEYSERFNVVCMFQVLEHLDKLDELFDHIGSLSKKRAHLFIAVSNAKRIEFNELNGGLRDMPPNHIGRWNRASFEIIAQRHGWRLAEHDIEVERLPAMIAQYVIYRYLYRRQNPDTLANRVERVSWRPVRRALQALMMCWYSLGVLNKLRILLKDRELGQSQWVHLQR